MKIILILFNIVFLAVLISAPALKKISPIRLFTFAMLLIYGMGIIKLITIFPIPCLLSLVVGMLAVLCIASRRHRSIHAEMKATDHEIQIVNWEHHDVRIKKKGISFEKKWTIS